LHFKIDESCNHEGWDSLVEPEDLANEDSQDGACVKAGKRQQSTINKTWSALISNAGWYFNFILLVELAACAMCDMQRKVGQVALSLQLAGL